MFGDADFSDDERYRFTLRRRWAPHRPLLTWIMLNPSIADERILDPTVRRVLGFSQCWGFGGFTVLNLFALRSTDPRVVRTTLRDHNDTAAIGVDNDDAIAAAVSDAPAVICAWGDMPRTSLKLAGGARRDLDVFELLRKAGTPTFSLGTTDHGQPRHPLYVPRRQIMEPFSGSRPAVDARSA